MATKAVHVTAPAGFDDVLQRASAAVKEQSLPSIQIQMDGLTISRSVAARDEVVPAGFATRITRAVALTATLGRFGAPETRTLKVLDGITGVLAAGTSTLVLGAPGSGKSSLLQTLSGRLAADVDSAVRYNGRTSEELASEGISVRKLAAYAPQVDVQEPLMTVRETLEFLAGAAGTNANGTTLVDDIIRVLGLKECENTFIGNQQIRGISGGQRRRVTIGEALVSGARVLALDEITNGLDSNAAAQIIAYITQWARATGGTVIAALQSPTPEIFAMFDSLVLLGDGMVLYHGPTAQVREFLFARGFAQPSYMDTADYLAQYVVSPANTAAMFAQDAAEQGAPPVDASALTLPAVHAAWLETAGAKEMKTAAASTTSASSSPWSAAALHAFGVRTRLTAFQQLQVLLSRQWKLVGRDKALVFGKVMQSIFMGLIIGSLFWRPDMSQFVLRMSLAVFGLIFLAYSNMPEIPVARNSKEVVLAQVRSGLYNPVYYVSSAMLLHLPVAALGDLIFCTLLYWMANFVDDAGRWAWFTFCGFTLDLACNALFRLYSYIAPTEELAGVLAGAGTGLQLMYAGFLISYNKLRPFTYAAYFLSPFSWAARSMVVSEFQAPQYGPLGQVYADVYGLHFTDAWRLAGPFVLIGYYLIFGIGACALALHIMRPLYARGTTRLSEFEARRAATSQPGAPLPPIAGAQRQTSDGSALPFRHAVLTWRNIDYTVVHPRTKKPLQLLHGVSGIARPGTLTALMGASGAGKTTLLDVLADRKTAGTIGGTKLVNGVETSKSDFARISAYCEQEDVHLGTSTVFEALTFSATLRLEADVLPAARLAFVESIMQTLELDALRNRTVSTLSPGERKRLTLGVELSSNPSILFLDEPTTGLDSRSAAVVMRVIEKVAARGLTVVCTIHQPSAAIFLRFTHLILLARGGRQVYAGPLGARAQTMVQYLEACPRVTPLPPFTNPASWMLAVIGDGNGVGADNGSISTSSSTTGLEEIAPASPSSPPAAPASENGTSAGQATGSQSPVRQHESHAALPLFARVYAGSSLHADNEAAIESAARDAEAFPRFASAMPATFALQMSTVFNRAVLDLWRDPTFQTIRLVVFLFIALYFGITFYDLEKNDQQGVLVTGALVFSTQVFSSIVYLNTSLPKLLDQRPVFYRERAAFFYLPEVWTIATIVKEIVWSLGFTLLFSSISYFMEGLRATAAAFWTYYFALASLCILYHIIAVFFSAMVPNAQVGQILGGVTVTFCNLFSGIVIPVANMPKDLSGGPGWAFMYYANGVAHSTRLANLAQYDPCTDVLNANCQPIQVVGQGRMTAYAYAAQLMSMTFDRRWEAAGWLWFISAVFTILAFAAYRFVNHQKR